MAVVVVVLGLVLQVPVGCCGLFEVVDEMCEMEVIEWCETVCGSDDVVWECWGAADEG